jgi:hypothetical protein
MIKFPPAGVSREVAGLVFVWPETAYSVLFAIKKAGQASRSSFGSPASLFCKIHCFPSPSYVGSGFVGNVYIFKETKYKICTDPEM